MVLRIIFPGLFSALVMLLLSFGWHGVVLNDFSGNFIPVSRFIIDYSISCVIIGIVFSYLFDTIRFKENKGLKRFGIGLIAGAVIYVMTFITGNTFGSQNTMLITMDFGWQMMEQGMGALTIHLLRYLFFFKSDDYRRRVFSN